LYGSVTVANIPMSLKR